MKITLDLYEYPETVTRRDGSTEVFTASYSILHGKKPADPSHTLVDTFELEITPKEKWVR